MLPTLEKYSSYGQESEDAPAREKIRVIIVDTHTLIRGALHKVVATFPRVQVCACLHSFENTTSIIRETRAQVAIFSDSISVSTCLDLSQVQAEGQGSMGIVVIQRCLHPETAMTLIKFGVRSLLGEEASEDDLARAIIAAATGNTFLDRRAREMLDYSAFRTSTHFTRREVEVLSSLKQGASNYEMARALDVSEKAIEKHLTHIYEKMHVRSRSEALLQMQHLQI